MLDASTLSYSIVSYYLLKYVWKNKVPAWAKEDVSFRTLLRGRKRSDNQNDNEDESNLSASEREELELSNLWSILEKLQALVQSIQLDEDHPSMLQQHAALLAYIQLTAQVKAEEQQPAENADGSAKGEEEKKDDEDEGEWTSRDSLYEKSRTCSLPSSVDPSLGAQYQQFAESPNESSPLRTKLEQALRFACYAYYDHVDPLSDRLANEEDCSVLEHSLDPSKPGYVAYYLALSSKSQNQLVLGIRGTSTLEDVVTDCCGRAVPLDDRTYYYCPNKQRGHNQSSDPSTIEVQAAQPNSVLHHDEEEFEIISGQTERVWVEEHTATNGSTTNGTSAAQNENYNLLYCHEGIMVSAKRLVDTIQGQVEHWVLERGYQLVICGHSLGSGVASLAAVLLRSRLPELTTTPAKMHVYCFAPPPILDREAALAASSYTTSVVNNADMIPRSSIENLVILLEILKQVWRELQRAGWAPEGAKSTAAFFQRIAKGAEADRLVPAAQLRRILVQAKNKVQQDAEQKRIQFENSKWRQTTETNKVPADTSASVDEVKPKASEPEESEDGATSRSNDAYHPHLYIPGVVLLGYEPWKGSRTTSSAKPISDCCSLKEQQEDIQATEEDGVQRKKEPMKWIVTDGTTNVLRFLEMDASSRMFMDHTTTSYYSLLDMEYQF